MTPEQLTAYTGIGTMIGLIIVGIMNRMDARKAIKAAESAAHVSDKIHTLVNSQMGIQLHMNWLQAQRIADMTKGTPSEAIDVASAKEAERLFNEHQAKQAVVDAMNAPENQI